MKTYASKLLYIFFGIFLLSLFSVPAVAGMLNVPGDFPGHFRMDLLAWNVHVDTISGGNGLSDAIPNTLAGGITFSASGFDGSGDPTWGTSALSNSVQNYLIGQGTFFSKDYEIYMNGSGAGILTDLGLGYGDWSLTFPIYIIWNNNFLQMSDLSLSTNSTVFYQNLVGDTLNESGTAMNYSTGDAILVGQSSIIDPSSALYGIRATFVIQANDPVAVPEPSSLFLIASGLVGLVGLKMKR